RHTRSKRDWSSDVCSSDLLIERLATGVEVRRMTQSTWRFTSALCAGRPLAAALDEARDFDASVLLADHLAAGRFIDFSLNKRARSEERRVGKEDRGQMGRQ